MKIRWSKPFDNKIYSSDKSGSVKYIPSQYNNSLKSNFLRNETKNNIIPPGQISLDISTSKKFTNDGYNSKYGIERKQHFINIKDYIFYFNDSEVFIFKIIIDDKIPNQVDNEIYKNQIIHSKEEISNSFGLNKIISSDCANESEEYYIKDIIIQDIKKINFLAYDEKIIYCLLNNENNFILLSTDFGNIYILNINLLDFYVELVFSFSIKQNYLYSYEILYFCENNNILVTLDNHLFICEIYKKKKNQPIQVFKNCLFKCEYMDEKLIYAEKLNNIVTVFSNKAIYLIDLYDISFKLFYKKENKNNFYGKILGDNIYFIKDENTYAVYSISDKDKKLSFKLSSKNQLNILNFDKILYLDGDLMIISNPKKTELYSISMVTYKILNRESILFENPNFLIFTRNEDDFEIRNKYYIKNEKSIIAFNLNKHNFDLKFKVGYIKQSEDILKKEINRNLDLKNNNNYDKNEENKENQKKEKIESLSIIQKDFVEEKLVFSNYVNEENNFKIISDTINIINTNKDFNKTNNSLNSNEENEIYELKEFESEYIEETNFEELIRKQLKKIKSLIFYFLKICDFKKYFKYFKTNINEKIFEKIVHQINILFNLLYYTSAFYNLSEIRKTENLWILIENRIKLTWINNYGSYSLKVSTKIIKENIQVQSAQVLINILKNCERLNDSNTQLHIFKKYGLFLNSMFKYFRNSFII